MLSSRCAYFVYHLDTSMQVHTEHFETICDDGVVLRGLLLIPAQPRAVLQFNNGTATKKEFYLAFLTYLAEAGYVCCLWDYRGSGASAPADLSGCPYTFRDYGLRDMPAIRRYLGQRFGDLPLVLFGHSAGGQQAGLMPELAGIRGMLTFGVSTGYAPNMPLGYRLQSHFFFYAFTPFFTRLTGYLPAKRFGIMEDLPRGVVEEWKAWCARPDYLFDRAFRGRTLPEGHYHAMPFPIHNIWATDDTIANERNFRHFWSHVHSPHGITSTRLDPRELGVREIGHFGLFKKHFRDLLWPKALAQLDILVKG